MAAAVRSGGTLAFNEPSVRPKQLSTPIVQQYEDAFEACFGAVRLTCPRHDVAHQLASLFHEAGLPEPELFLEAAIGTGEDCPFYALVAEAFRVARPVIEKHGLWHGGTSSGDFLEQEIRLEAVRLHSQLQYPEQICAWARL